MNGSKRNWVEAASVDTDTNKITLTLRNTVAADDVITLDYTTTSKNQNKGVIEDLAGNDLETIKGVKVVNNTVDNITGQKVNSAKLPKERKRDNSEVEITQKFALSPDTSHDQNMNLGFSPYTTAESGEEGANLLDNIFDTFNAPA